jgi:hypothetical protein
MTIKKLFEIFNSHTLFKQIHNIHNSEIFIEYANSSIYPYVYNTFYEENKIYNNEDNIDIFVECKYISEYDFNNKYYIINKSDTNTEKIIDMFINYKFDVLTFRDFLINLLPKYTYKFNLLIKFDDPLTGNVLEYKIQFSTISKLIKIIVLNGFYGI